MSEIQTKNQRIVINKGYEIIAFNVSDFLYAKADSNVCVIHLLNKGSMIVGYSIKELEGLFKNYPNIIKVHRSNIINLHNVVKINIGCKPFAELCNNATVPISRAKKEQVAMQYAEFAF